MKSFSAIEFQVVDYSNPDFDKFWAPAEKRISDFISLFLKQEYFGKVVILFNKFLRNQKDFGIQKNESCKIIKDASEAETFKSHIIDACISGHMSVLFIAKENSSLLQAYQEKKYYNKLDAVHFESNILKNPLNGKELDQFVYYLEHLRVGSDINAFVFSHDADCFYKIPH